MLMVVRPQLNRHQAYFVRDGMAELRKSYERDRLALEQGTTHGQCNCSVEENSHRHQSECPSLLKQKISYPCFTAMPGSISTAASAAFVPRMVGGLRGRDQSWTLSEVVLTSLVHTMTGLLWRSLVVVRLVLKAWTSPGISRPDHGLSHPLTHPFSI
jgi:hypothetical protein